MVEGEMEKRERVEAAEKERKKKKEGEAYGYCKEVSTQCKHVLTTLL